MTYLQMYIIITVWIFHKTERGGEFIAQQEGNRKITNFSLHVTFQHTHTHWTPFLHIHIVKHEVLFVHPHDAAAWLRFKAAEMYHISDQRDCYRWPNQMRRISVPQRIRRHSLGKSHATILHRLLFYFCARKQTAKKQTNKKDATISTFSAAHGHIN